VWLRIGAGVAVGLAAIAWLWLDEPVMAALRAVEFGRWQLLVKVFSDLGLGITAASLFLVVLVFRDEVALALAGMIGTTAGGLLVQAVKAAIGRPRPTGGGSAAFPSGHTTTVFIVAVVLGARYRRARIPLAVAALVVGASRVLLLRHYPSDVFAGAGVGIGLGLLSCELAPRLDRPAVLAWARWAGPFALFVTTAFGVVGGGGARRLSVLVFPALTLVAGWRMLVDCGFDGRRERGFGSEEDQAEPAGPVETESGAASVEAT
jgi:undecaprenyl-diphosphatase